MTLAASPSPVAAEAPPPPDSPTAVATGSDDDDRDISWWARAVVLAYHEYATRKAAGALPIVNQFQLERSLYERLEVLRTFYVPPGTPPANPSIIPSDVRSRTPMNL